MNFFFDFCISGNFCFSGFYCIIKLVSQCTCICIRSMETEIEAGIEDLAIVADFYRWFVMFSTKFFVELIHFVNIQSGI